MLPTPAGKLLGARTEYDGRIELMDMSGKVVFMTGNYFASCLHSDNWLRSIQMMDLMK